MGKSIVYAHRELSKTPLLDTLPKVHQKWTVLWRICIGEASICCQLFQSEISNKAQNILCSTMDNTFELNPCANASLSNNNESGAR